MKKKIIVKTGINAEKQWYAPDNNPLSKSVPHMNNYTKSNTWIYYFNSLVQYNNMIGKSDYKTYKCIECNKTDTLQSNGWHWRPMIDFNRTIMVLHQRLRCQGTCGCGKTFATISPTFMKQLPTCLVDSFPYLTTPSGLGISSGMMDQFLVLITLGISFTPYARSINEMRMSSYWSQHISYLDHVSDTFDSLDERIGATPFNPEPFSHFKDNDNYMVILLQPRLLKILFIQHMSRCE